MSTTSLRSGRFLAGMMLLFALAAFAMRALIIGVAGLASGPGFWLALGFFGVAVALTLQAALRWFSLSRGRGRNWDQFTNASVVIGAVAFSCMGLEIALNILADTDTPLAGKPIHAQIHVPVKEDTAAPRSIRVGAAEITLSADMVRRLADRQRLWTMPDAWIMRPVEVPGATYAVEWHGALHVFDASGFRRVDAPFPPAGTDKTRIMVVGDSMTYGIGVPAEWTYPALLQRILGASRAVEVINLGVAGAASEDIVRLVARMTPQLRPHLIVYGMCLNDFLPSGGQEQVHAVGIPLPYWIRQLGVERTRLGRLMDDAYRNILVRLGISLDFWDDVLKDFNQYQARFASDMKQLRGLGDAAGLPPVIAMVLDQLPDTGSRGHRLTMIAEAAFRDAGLTVIPTEDFYRIHDKRPLFVSRWELHPNEEAHAIFAVMIADHLLRDGNIPPPRRP